MEPIERLEAIDQEIIAVHLEQSRLRVIEHELFAEKLEIIKKLGNRAITNEAETRATDQ